MCNTLSGYPFLTVLTFWIYLPPSHCHRPPLSFPRCPSSHKCYNQLQIVPPVKTGVQLTGNKFRISTHEFSSDNNWQVSRSLLGNPSGVGGVTESEDAHYLWLLWRRETNITLSLSLWTETFTVFLNWHLVNWLLSLCTVCPLLSLGVQLWVSQMFFQCLKEQGNYLITDNTTTCFLFILCSSVIYLYIAQAI